MIPISHSAMTLRAALVAALLAMSGPLHAGGADAPEPAAVAGTDSQVRAVFQACAPRTGCEPWITDGTRGNTKLLRNLMVDWHSSPHEFADLGDGRVAFTAWHLMDGRLTVQPYITDGTRAGTRVFRRLPDNQTSPRAYTGLGDGRFVFLTDRWSDGYGHTLWVSDGTRQGTSVIARFPETRWLEERPTEFTRLRDGQIVFRAYTPRSGVELWTTDGTSEGTRLLRKIGVDESSVPRELTRIADGLVVFTATTPGLGSRPWVTDGTRRGTRMLANVFGGSGYTPVGASRAIFEARALDQVSVPLVFVTDGTPEGTHVLQEGAAGERLGGPEEFGRLDDTRSLIVAHTGFKKRLFVTDGTSRGTRRIHTPTGYTNLRYFSALGDGRAVFWVRPAETYDSVLWVTDGTARGTRRVANFPNMPWGYLHRTPVSLGNGLALFSARTDRAEWQPWVTDGTREGTAMLARINRTGSSTDPFTTFTPFSRP